MIAGFPRQTSIAARRLLLRQALMKPVRRWTPHRKRALVEGVDLGALTGAEAFRIHGVTDAELTIWRTLLGLRGDVRDLRLRSIQERSFRAPVPPLPSFEEAAAAAA